MTKGLRALTVAVATGTASAAYAADLMVGGAPMSPSKTVVQNASAAPNLTTLVAAVKAAIVDGKGGTALVETPDVYQSNGVAHVIGSVLTPK